MSAAGKALSLALDRPEDWDFRSRYTIRHKPSNQIFWVGNGGFFFDGYAVEGTPECLGLIERHFLYRKAKHLQANLVAQRLKAHA